jgi:hypothetical protein
MSYLSGDDVIVTFFGTPRQISLAKSLVEEKVEEDRELREGIMHRLRSPRSPARQFCLTNSPHEVVIICISHTASFNFS